MKNVVLVIAVLAVAAFVYFNFFKKEVAASETPKTQRQRFMDQVAIEGKVKFIESQQLDKIISNYGSPVLDPMPGGLMPTTFAMTNGGSGAEGTFQTCLHQLIELGIPAKDAWRYCEKNEQISVSNGTGEWNFNNVGAATPVLNPNNLIKLNNYQS